MKLRLGLNQDGQRGRVTGSRLGEADVGPLGLLNILETQLGLIVPSVSNSQRVVQYRDCLAKLDAAHRFFHKSFQADDFGSAATLLAWRDEWRLHGWNGRIGKGESPRLLDMADVESLAIKEVSPGLAERLDRVRHALGKRPCLISSITLVDELECFPYLWKLLLEVLPVTGAQQYSASGKGMLGELQRALLAAASGAHPSAVNWNNDGSVAIVRCETTLSGARWLAESLARSDDDTLLVATAEAARTDLVMGAAGNPHQGLSESTAFRPALQVLSMVIELLWKPLNFHALVQFLTHPICPLPGRIRHRLAVLQGERPGIGGPRWQQLQEKITAEAGEASSKVLEEIRFWVEHERFDPKEGVPVEFILERARRLATFFSSGQQSDDAAWRAACAAAASQCQSFTRDLTSLLSQGAQRLEQRQLEQLAAQATARGGINPVRIAQVGAVPCITHPGAAIDTYNTVVWGPLEAPVLPSPRPWSPAEIVALRECGCRLQTEDSRLQQLSFQWLRPILSAKDRLVIILPPSTTESHPIWQLIQSLVPDMPIQQAESALQDSTNPSLIQIQHRSLPKPRRWWELPKDTPIKPVETYSFSQLEKLLFNPYHWLLRYAANLKPGTLRAVQDDFRLKGLLAHSLIERLYLEPNALAMSDIEFDKWFVPAFDRLIAEEGAVYLMPGRRIEMENLRQSLHVAVGYLRKLLLNASVATVEPERELAGHFRGGKLQGFADLVLTKLDKSMAIVDIKWTGKSYRSKLEESRHLQLAIYGELIRQTNSNWPVLAYYLIQGSQLLTRDEFWFPGVPAVRAASEENTAELWEKFLTTWDWRKTQLDERKFEVIVDGTDDEEPGQPPEGSLELEKQSSRYNECAYLAGWKEEA